VADRRWAAAVAGGAAGAPRPSNQVGYQLSTSNQQLPVGLPGFLTPARLRCALHSRLRPSRAGAFYEHLQCGGGSKVLEGGPGLKFSYMIFADILEGG
jgi:hypothetical protein